MSIFIRCCAIFVTILVGCQPPASPHAEDATRPSLAPTTWNEADDVDSQKSLTTEFGIALQADRKHQNSVLIGLNADMTSGAAKAGESIRRGAFLAIDQINQAGGLLGRKVELVVRDHRGNPERGIDNMLEFCETPDVLAVVGGLHTPVALRELKCIHQHQMIYLVPWAAGTGVVSNGYSPNFVFRVSVRDQYAGEFLVESCRDRGLRRLGLMLERTGWGRSNEAAINAALANYGSQPARVEWFNWGDSDFSDNLERLHQSGAEAIIYVGNPLEGKVLVHSMAALPPSKRLPIISHWGITGTDFAELCGDSLQSVDLMFLQTYSFVRPPRPRRSAELFKLYQESFPDCRNPRQLFSPAGTAHAYDIVMMLAAAVREADSLDRSQVRSALESLPEFDGVVRHYAPPFQVDLHDALTTEDFIMAEFDNDGAILPVAEK